MGRHVLLFVHGMGDYVDDDGNPHSNWFKLATNTLEDQYKKYDFLNRQPLDQRFKTVNVHYDAILHNLVSSWTQQNADLKRPDFDIGGPAQQVLDWLESTDRREDDFAWTHVLDAVLYRCFPLVRQTVKTHVAKQFYDALKPSSNSSVSSWSVISHSLGCIVTHDVLHAMDTSGQSGSGVSMLDSIVPSAQVVAMIANVSKLLENDCPVYQSKVVPQGTENPSTACLRYLSANNKYDPFVSPDPFQPDGNPPWDSAKRQGTFLDIGVDNVNELNVHSFRNYLVNPSVHVPLFNLLAGRGTISTDEQRHAQDLFDDRNAGDFLEDSASFMKDTEELEWYQRAKKFYERLQSSH